MDFLYAAMWFVVGFLLLFSMSKENKVFYFAGGFFMLLGCWWLANGLWPQLGLFSGVWGWVLKGVTGVALVVLGVVFFREYRKKEKEAKEKQGAQGKGESPSAPSEDQEGW